MDEKGKGILGRRDATSEEIGQAMGWAINEALRDHKRAGNPVAIWDVETGRAVVVPPEQIILMDDHLGANSAGNGAETHIEDPSASEATHPNLTSKSEAR